MKHNERSQEECDAFGKRRSLAKLRRRVLLKKRGEQEIPQEDYRTVEFSDLVYVTMRGRSPYAS